MLKIWKTSIFSEKLLLYNIKKKLAVTQTHSFNFSSATSHSGSETEPEHENHDEDHTHQNENADVPLISEGNFAEETRSRIFNRQETFSVDNLLNKLKAPIMERDKKLDQSGIQVYKSEEEYINFLAVNFEKKAIEKYPDYKKNLDQFKHLIPNYESLNAYQREVLTLDTYLHWQLEVEELKIRQLYNFTGNSLERARQRFAFFQNLMAEDLHRDTKIMHHLKEKLREILQGELEWEEFKHKYNETVENQLIENIIENRKKTFYFDIIKNKKEFEKNLNDLNSPGNKHKFKSSVTPHDHIHPQHWSKDPEKVNEEKWKYLAYFDIIIDQHLRQVRPSSISERDEMFKYVKDEYRPLKYVKNDIYENMYYDYLFTLDNEFYVKFKEMIERSIDVGEEVEDKNRPAGKHWKEEYKFPHVADRLGWDFLQETPWDKNPFVERIVSHPMYQWQPFVQTPSWEPDKDLCLEQGETIYENKWVFEWVLFWRLLFIFSFFPLYWYFYESYNNNTVSSPEYTRRFTFWVPAFNMAWRGLPRRMPETVNYWGDSLWLWQHWIRKGLVYPLVLILTMYLKNVFKSGHNYVIKAAYNREKDLVFMWRPTRVFFKELHIYELHYLEITTPRITSSWSDLGHFKKDGIFTLYDLRTGEELFFYNEKKYWNIDERDHFFKNTNTFWKGLRHKDVDRGIFFNNSNVLTEEEIVTTKKINEEVKAAVEKYGPLQVTDYDFNYKYQLKKRIQDMKRQLIEGKEIDTSMYGESLAGKSHDEHGDVIAKHSMH